MTTVGSHSVASDVTVDRVGLGEPEATQITDRPEEKNTTQPQWNMNENSVEEGEAARNASLEESVWSLAESSVKRELEGEVPPIVCFRTRWVSLQMFSWQSMEI